jgi:hypothetical protein
LKNKIEWQYAKNTPYIWRYSGTFQKGKISFYHN